MVGGQGYSWWPGGELTFGLALILRQPYCLRRPRGKRSRGQEQVARPVPALERRSVGVICFCGGTDVPSAGQPLSSATLGGVWKVACLGDGRNKSGPRLHIESFLFQAKLQAGPVHHRYPLTQ